jgi:hypothetical protein
MPMFFFEKLWYTEKFRGTPKIGIYIIRIYYYTKYGIIWYNYPKKKWDYWLHFVNWCDTCNLLGTFDGRISPTEFMGIEHNSSWNNGENDGTWDERGWVPQHPLVKSCRGQSPRICTFRVQGHKEASRLFVNEPQLPRLMVGQQNTMCIYIYVCVYMCICICIYI